jgi:chromosomal replication initiation ATPase DnaA
MNMSKTKQSAEAAEFARNFIKEFQSKFGILPRVNYSFDVKQLKISLSDLEEVINHLISKDPSIDIKGASIRTKTRLRELVMYRQCAFKIACEVGYGPSSIANYFGWDHATVIYACKTVRNLVASNDKKLTTTLTNIEDELEERFRVDGSIQPNSKAENNS